MPPSVRLPYVYFTLLLLLTNPYWAGGQTQNRITGEVDLAQTAPLKGSAHPLARAQNDDGRVSDGTRLSGITIYFKPTAKQKAELDALVDAQQTPGSSWYHKWLTPTGYARRFGISNSDIAKIEGWLEQQGFAIDRVSNSHNSISFSGTVGQVQSTFQTEIHYYKVDSETHFANSAQISVPSALAGVILSVRNLDDFRPKPQVRFRRPTAGTAPRFTSGQSGTHYLQPGDVAIIYDINAAYNTGYTGTGQSIAIVGQSEIDVSDIEDFQNAAGLTVKDPTQVLVPDSGTATFSSGDQAESDLDLEYSSAIAKGATIYFVYVGNNQNYSAFDSLQYAIDTRIAPIISMSYGGCETGLSPSDYSTLESIMEQGISQGQSIIVASGDSGSTSCYGESDLTSTQQEALAVDYPASSAYVTAMGGTEFPTSDVSSSNSTYWESASGSDVVTSARSYIPEQAWNDDSSEYGLASGGGGTSALTARPSWQTVVPGIPSGNYRLVPDISLDSSPENAGYLYCTSDTSAWSNGQQASCNTGFRDSSTQHLTVAGGTSFAAPIFAGMLAIINEKENSTGQGLINSTLYALAANSSRYASAFHDITSGGNQCAAGTKDCSSAGESEYPAAAGYDEASGLGSVDLYNLLTAWTPGSSSSLETTTTSLSAATSTPASGANDTITITVSTDSSSITSTPTGTLTIVVDGTTETSSLALSNGSATYTFSYTTSGSHVIEATYSGNATFASSTGSVTVDVGGSSSGSSGGTFTVSATNVTVSQGSSGTSTITVTSKNSYAGTVGFTLSTSSTSLSEYGCYDIPDSTVSANSTATATLTIHTSKSDCNSSSIRHSMRHSFVKIGTTSFLSSGKASMPRRTVPAGFATAFAGFLLVRIRKRRASLLTSLLLLMGILGLSLGCGGSGSIPDDVAKGTYTLSSMERTLRTPASRLQLP
jgi:subtilase family serine protease